MSHSTLQLAQQKLQATDIPLQLRVTYYLRICSTALADQGIRYTTLLQSLTQHNPNWLDTVTVSKTGLLQSSDRTINQMLKPFKALYKTSRKDIASLPIAA